MSQIRWWELLFVVGRAFTRLLVPSSNEVVHGNGSRINILAKGAECGFLTDSRKVCTREGVLSGVHHSTTSASPHSMEAKRRSIPSCSTCERLDVHVRGQWHILCVLD